MVRQVTGSPGASDCVQIFTLLDDLVILYFVCIQEFIGIWFTGNPAGTFDINQDDYVLFRYQNVMDLNLTNDKYFINRACPINLLEQVTS